MTPRRHGSAIIEFPTELEVLTTRAFDAPIELVFDVLTNPDHMRHWFAAFEDTLKMCSIDLRVGGNYHLVTETPDGRTCSFSGTYLEVVPPTRTVQTWRFDGWPGVEAVETVELQETGAVTTMTVRLTFPDQAGRDHMTRFDGQESSWDHLEDYLTSLLNDRGEGLSA